MKGPAWIAFCMLAAVLGLCVVVSPGLLLLIPLSFLAFGGLVLAKRRPEAALSLCFLFVLLALTRYRVRGGVVGISVAVDLQVLMQLGLYALIFCMTLIASARFPRRWILSRSELALAGYVAFAVLSAVWSPVHMFTAVLGVQLLVLLLLAIVASRTLGPQRTLAAVALMSVAYALTFSIVAVVFPPFGPALSPWAGARFAWLKVHPGTVGMIAGSGSLLLLARLLFARDSGPARRPGIAVWLALFFMLLLLLATRSRGPLIAFVASLGVLLLFRWGRGGESAGIVFLAAAASLILLSFGRTPDDLLRAAIESDLPGVAYLLRGQTAEQFESLTGRLDLWEYAGSIVLEKPFVGHGYLSSRVLLGAFSWSGYAHNGLMQSLLDFGLVGTVWLWGTTVAIATSVLPVRFRDRPRDRPVGAATFAIVFYLLVLSVTGACFAGPPGWEVLLLFVAASVSAHRSDERAVFPSTSGVV